MIDTLNDNDDVQNVYANFEVSDALVAKMSALSTSLALPDHRALIPHIQG